MIYECEGCDAVLTAGAAACPQCGEVFDEPVPEDAESPWTALEKPPAVNPPVITGRRQVQELMNKHREKFKIDEESLRLLEDGDAA